MREARRSAVSGGSGAELMLSDDGECKRGVSTTANAAANQRSPTPCGTWTHGSWKCRGDFRENPLNYIWKGSWLGRLFFSKTVVLCYYTLPLQHTPSEWSSKTVNDPEIPTPLHSTPRPSWRLWLELVYCAATHAQLRAIIGGIVEGRSTRTQCSRLQIRRVCPISASCVVAIFG